MARKKTDATPADTTKPFDVVIIGAGPAGATSAVFLAEKGHRVALVEAAKPPRKTVCAGWLSHKVVPLLSRIGLTPADCGAKPLEKVTFYNGDLSKSAVPAFKETPGYLVDRPRFDRMLIDEAVKHGACFLGDQRVVDVGLKESSVAVAIENARPIQGSLLILASGRGSPLIERLRLPHSMLLEGWWAAQIEVDKVRGVAEPWMAIIMGIDRFGGIGQVVAHDGHVTIGIQTPADRSGVIVAITTLCKNLASRGILKNDLSEQAARATPIATPASVALAMDTHVAKRSLVIGDAGGFVSATSGEGVFPAMWSAQIAAEVVEKALKSRSPQDALMDFNVRWRTEMADYLKPPNTDTQYIFPLVFTNQPMADRMGAAFFSGENI